MRRRSFTPIAASAALALSAAMAAAPDALADGKVFSKAHPRVEIPDQEALISWRDGVETIVVETRYEGQGTDFAWVVPLPSVPDAVEAATPGTFPTLRTLHEPEVVDRWTPLYAPAIVIALILFVALTRPSHVFVRVLVYVFFGAILLSLAVPSPLRARKAASPRASAVTVHQRRIVGKFDTATLSSTDPKELLAWLEQNGFQAPPEIGPVVADYVKDGWIFVAARIAREAGGAGPSSTHPLAFTFKTPRAVYPLRLTGAGNGPLRVVLYVFADQRARAPLFEVERCARVDRGRDLAHDGIRRFSSGGSCVTKLKATLSPLDLKADVRLSWEPFREARTTLYSRPAANAIVLDIFVLALLPGLLVLLVVERRARLRPVRSLTWALIILNAAILAAGIVHQNLPRTGVIRGSLRAGGLSQHLLDNLALQAQEARIADPAFVPTEEWARERLRAIVRGLKNRFTGEPVREEDSPGNYTVRAGEEGPELLNYDGRGAADASPLDPIFSRHPAGKK